MIERLLEPDCSDAPACACGGEMTLSATEPRSDDVTLKRYGSQNAGASYA